MGFPGHQIRKDLKSRMSPGSDPVSSSRIERNAGWGMNGGEKKCTVKGRAKERKGEQIVNIYSLLLYYMPGSIVTV